MQRINTLLQKLTELAAQDVKPTIIDIDLMLDYTRVLYADLLEVRKDATTVHIPPQPVSSVPRVDTGITDYVPDTTPPEIKYADVPNNDIRTQIGINDKYLYISELFGDDKVAYDTAIKQLNSFNTLAEATAWVDNELSITYNWDKESETVHSFYNLLSNSFSAM